MAGIRKRDPEIMKQIIITLRDVKIKIIKRGNGLDLNDIHMMNRKI